MSNTNILIYTDDAHEAHETAKRLQAMLHFLAGAALSDAVGDEEGNRAMSMLMDMCAEAAAFIADKSLTSLGHPARSV